MTLTRLFPIILMILDICASIVYFTSGDKPRGIYWLSAGLLTYSTLIIK